jgi:hypothetical protein
MTKSPIWTFADIRHGGGNVQIQSPNRSNSFYRATCRSIRRSGMSHVMAIVM